MNAKTPTREQSQKNGLTLLTRLAARHGPARSYLLQSLGKDIHTLAKIAIDVGIETGGPMGQELLKALQSKPDETLLLAASLANQIPIDTIALSELGLHCEQCQFDSIPSHSSQQAESARVLAARLRTLGEFKKAYEVTLQAVASCRTALKLNQSGDKPENKPRQPSHEQAPLVANLAASLNSHAAACSYNDQLAAQLDAINESVALYQTLIQQNPSDKKWLFLHADSQRDQASALTDTGDFKNAINSSRKAVETFRQLHEGAMNNQSARNLGIALMTDGIVQADAGFFEQGRHRLNEVQRIFETLADAKSDTWSSDLARAQDVVGTIHLALGQYTAGLRLADQAIKHFKALYEERPTTHYVALARALNNRSTLHESLGDVDHALADTVQAVGLLAAERPHGNGNNRGLLADALLTLAGRYETAGDYPQARQAIDQSISILHTLRQVNPGIHQASLAKALGNAATISVRENRIDQAWTDIQKAIQFLRALYHQTPQAYTADLALALRNSVPIAERLDKSEEGLQASLESVSMYRQLAENDNHGRQDNLALAGALANAAAMQTSNAQHTQAIALGEEALTIFDQAIHDHANANPESISPTTWTLERAATATHLANAFAECKELELAETHAQAAVHDYAAMSESRPDLAINGYCAACQANAKIAALNKDYSLAKDFMEAAIEGLNPWFLEHPKEHAATLKILLVSYQGYCEASDSTVDTQLLTPFLNTLSNCSES